jgi:serine/threonine protein kinase
MTEPDAGRWHLIERHYDEAMERDADRRDAFLDEACAGDAELRREVASLLRYGGATRGFLGRPALLDAATGIAEDDDAPPPGRIAGYEILSRLGAGGMGVVYRARDIRLDRDVAIKVLARPIASDPGYRHRFEEEARAASGLNHPNIVTIYGVGEDDGIPYIAMEVVRGRTLRAVMADDPLTVAAALSCGAPTSNARWRTCSLFRTKSSAPSSKQGCTCAWRTRIGAG